MPTYEELKEQMLQEDAADVAVMPELPESEISTELDQPVAARPASSFAGQWLIGIAALAFVAGLTFVLPAVVDRQKPDKSKVENRLDFLMWLFDADSKDDGTSKKKQKDTYGPFDSVFE